jgi:hypothetical protein
VDTAELERFEGTQATAGAVPDLLVEVPHGATSAADYERVRRALMGPLPDQLEHFFHVNTDEGAPELGRAIAKAVVQQRPTWTALVVRCRIPRTFIDTNRLADLPGGNLQQGGLTPGLQPYIQDEADQDLLRSLHADYQALCDPHYAQVCGAGGLALIPHSYAPRSVGIQQVDSHIVEALHRVYAPGLAETWPLRPEVDLITRTKEGRVLAADVVDMVLSSLSKAGIQAGDGDTYFLHPSTMGAIRAGAWPGQTLCWEVRRDKLADPWPPFSEATIDPLSVARFAAPFAAAAVAWLDGRATRVTATAAGSLGPH